MGAYSMPAQTARTLLAALQARGVTVCVGGGWGVDALVGRQTRPHADLDLWLDAAETEPVFATMAAEGVDRIHPWPGDRPWNFVLHDGHSRRVDLHMYEQVGGGRLHYGSVVAPFRFTQRDLSGHGEIADLSVRCEAPEFAVGNHTGYPPRDTDRHDVNLLCECFGLSPPAELRRRS